MVIMADPTTDKRIDELSKRLDFGFEQTNERLGRVEDDLRDLRSEMNVRFDKVDAKFDKVDARFGKVDDEFKAVRSETKAGFDGVADEFTTVRAEMKAGFDGMQRLMIRFFAGTLGTVIAGVIVTIITVLSHS
jgi:hypothetical protein